ncbi:MAG TPA: FliM/FliN family flagellar motor switch protein [Gemmataceae bacterium]|nr:FliM/FliN family flagellar motor switch protein [Gemmataceae bacterium]
MSSKIRPYDFARPSRLAADLELRLRAWFKAAATLAAKSWSKRLGFPIELEVQELAALPAADALEKVAENAFGFRLAEPRLGTSLLALPRPLLLALISGLLSEPVSALPEDRDLTSVEESLGEHLMGAAWLRVLQQTWPGATPLALTLQQKETQPRYVRIFPPAENVIVCVFLLRGPFGEQEWYWLIPQRGLATDLVPAGSASEATAVTGRPTRECLEALVRDLKLEFTVLLGSVELPLRQVSQLRVGDVVILDQRCGDLLTAAIDGKKKFQGWPGRVGDHQALLIHAVLASPSGSAHRTT